VVASLEVQEGQHVTQGEVLATLETTKSTAEVICEGEGYVTGLRFRQGQAARAGEVFCTLVKSKPEEPSHKGKAAAPSPIEGSLPEGLRITQPALALARGHGLALDALPTGPLVTERLVRSILGNIQPGGDLASGALPLPIPQARVEFAYPAQAFDPAAILIYGGGGHGKIVIDLLRALAVYRLAGILDDGRQPGENILGVPVLGGAELLPRLFTEGLRLAVNAIGGISSVAVRIKIFHRLAEAGFTCPAIVHPTALVERSAVLEPGAQVLAHAYLGSEAHAGYGTIVSTGAIVSHDCRLGNYVNVSPGAILAGDVQVGDGALIGMGVTVNLGVKIGAGARIGNGATVNIDGPEGGIVRSGTIWPHGIEK
jgi:sugar O-acyltransferase (sialic acid O-acetyltransferase NeuD family)